MKNNMKILAINCNPDLKYFTDKGLNFEVEHKTINEIFPVRFLYNVLNQSGVSVPMFTPWPEQYLEQNYKDFKYSYILIGFDPANYSNDLKNIGGYTHHTALSSGIRWATIRQDNNSSNYISHELNHLICSTINIDFGHHVPKDFMDMDRYGRPYYKNDDMNAPDGNFAQTWEGIAPFVDRLNSITYSDKKQVVLTRLYEWKGVETVGKLEVGTFFCNTLELAWKDNQKNISCIPKGEYKVKWGYSWKFGWCYKIQNVPNRTDILFHAGNYFFDTLGCILVGKTYGDPNNDKFPDVLNSRSTLNEFVNYMGKKEFTLLIK